MIRSALLFAAFIMVLAACASASVTPTPAPEAFVAQTLALPGAHLALAPGAPAGYDVQTPNRVHTLNQSRQDVWLYAPPAALASADPEGALQAWLLAARALHFPNHGTDLYWIPGDDAVDRLQIAEQYGVLAAVEPAQQAELWHERGDAFRRANAYEDAIQAYNQALTLNPNRAETYAGLGAALLALGRNEDALTPLQQATLLDPNHFWAHRLLGNAYLNLQRWTLAAEQLTQAYILDPTDPHILLGIALGQGRSGQRELALRTLAQFDARNDNPKLRADAELLRQEFTSENVKSNE